MTDLTPVVKAVIALVAVLISAFVIPWIKSKTTAQDREELLRWVDIAVAAAQQLFHQFDGATRLEHALSILDEQGYDIDDKVVLSAVEAAVLRLHQQLTAGDTNDS